MNPAARPQTSRNRDRALARLNSITTGTAIAAAIATAGFGALAAFNYTGTADAASTTTDDGAAALGAATSDPGVGGVVGVKPSATNSTSATAGLQSISPPVAAVKKKAKVTSGGSH